MKYRDSWSFAEGEDEDLPFLIRFRSLDNRAAFFEGHPHLIEINWPLQHPTSYGLPLPQEVPALDEFAYRLTGALEDEDAAVLTLVTTHDNVRTFVLYAGDLAHFTEAFNRLFQRDPPYPIALVGTYDDAGALYAEMVEHCVEP